jgi:hypothetical protein
MSDEFLSRLESAIERGSRRKASQENLKRAQQMSVEDARRLHTCYRDDINLSGGKRSNKYSRLEITIRPQSEYNVLDLRAKGTIANKEVFNRNVFEPLEQADQATFEQLIDGWVIEYAELFSAAN